MPKGQSPLEMQNYSDEERNFGVVFMEWSDRESSGDFGRYFLICRNFSGDGVRKSRLTRDPHIMSALKIREKRDDTHTKTLSPSHTRTHHHQRQTSPIHAMPLERDAESSSVHHLEEDEEQEDGDEQPQDQRNKRRRTDAARFVVPP